MKFKVIALAALMGISGMAKNMEIQELYAKYGISPRGSCIQLLIQFPILLALYRFINSMPAYVTQIMDNLKVLAY